MSINIGVIMSVISFSENGEHIWHAAGWAFRQVLDDVSRQYAADHEIVEKCERAKMYSGLIVYLFDPALAARIKAAIKNVATGIREGTISSGITQQPYGDAVTIEQYLNSLGELLRILHTSDSS